MRRKGKASAREDIGQRRPKDDGEQRGEQRGHEAEQNSGEDRGLRQFVPSLRADRTPDQRDDGESQEEQRDDARCRRSTSGSVGGDA